MAVPARLESQDPRFASRLFADAGGRYDVVSEALSFGQYHVWQDELVSAARRRGVDADSHVLDVATGTGKIATRLREEIGCSVTGVDLTRGMLRIAQAKRGAPIPGDYWLVQGTADALPFPDASFDALTFSYLYRYVPDPAATTRELVRVLRPGGFMGFIEFHVPPDPALRAMWRLHTRLNLPLFGGLAGRDWRDIGRFLGPNIEAFYRDWDVPRMSEMLRAAGCEEVTARLLSLGGGLVMHARKAPIHAEVPA